MRNSQFTYYLASKYPKTLCVVEGFNVQMGYCHVEFLFYLIDCDCELRKQKILFRMRWLGLAVEKILIASETPHIVYRWIDHSTQNLFMLFLGTQQKLPEFCIGINLYSLMKVYILSAISNNAYGHKFPSLRDILGNRLLLNSTR